MVFNTNQAWSLLGFVWGQYEGETFVKSDSFGGRVSYTWTVFVWIQLIYNIARYLVLAVTPPSQHYAIDFYCCDYCVAVEGRPYRVFILAGPLYNVWAGCFTWLFNRMMYGDKRYRYWLRYFQIPMKRDPDEVKFVAYSSEKLAKFWKLSSKLQSTVLKSLFYQAIFVMSLSATSYLLIMYRKYNDKLHSAAVFWTILLGNYFSLVFNGTICLVGISGSTVYFYLNARMLAERFTHVTQKLQNFAYGREPIDPVKIDKLLLQFNILIDELHKCNFFWSKMMAFNYYISLAICCTEILVGLFVEDLFMVFFCAILFLMTYFPTLVICGLASGNLHLKIRKAHQPMTNLLANQQLKFPTTIRMVRILDWITSEYSGIRVANLFLVRKDLILHLFLELVANVILLFDLIYFMFPG